MTTKITSIYGALDTFASTQLGATYKKLSDSYNPEDNSALILTKAYGLAIGPGNNTNRMLGCQLSISRDFDIIIINQVLTTENNTSQINTIEKNLMEDQFKLIKGIEKDPSLSQYVAKVLYQNDTGIQYLATEESKKYMAIITTFNLEYFENL